MLEALAYFGLSLATYRPTDCRSRLSSRVEALAVVQVWASSGFWVSLPYAYCRTPYACLGRSADLTLITKL
jgi:hypothetical protein